MSFPTCSHGKKCYEVAISHEFAQCKSNKNVRLLEKRKQEDPLLTPPLIILIYNNNIVYTIIILYEFI